jgi:hypothetical protein
MVMLDITRCVDKIYKTIDADRSEIKSLYEGEVQARLEKEREKGRT